MRALCTEESNEIANSVFKKIIVTTQVQFAEGPKRFPVSGPSILILYVRLDCTVLHQRRDLEGDHFWEFGCKIFHEGPDRRQKALPVGQKRRNCGVPRTPVRQDAA